MQYTNLLAVVGPTLMQNATRFTPLRSWQLDTRALPSRRRRHRSRQHGLAARGDVPALTDEEARFVEREADQVGDVVLGAHDLDERRPEPDPAHRFDVFAVTVPRSLQPGVRLLRSLFSKTHTMSRPAAMVMAWHGMAWRWRWRRRCGALWRCRA